MKYKQVQLKGIGIHHGFETIAWIPEKFAKEGNEITIGTERNILWRVYWVSENTIGDAIYPEALIKAHRSNTGDSLNKKG
jgi:hypothetical protein